MRAKGETSDDGMRLRGRAGSRGGTAAPRRMAVLAALALAGLVALPGSAQDARTMIRTLAEGDDFRVRVQAAFAMGNTRDSVFRPHLERALRDRNPAVRAAAATALGRLGDRRALGALRRARRDRSASVRMQAERSIRTLSQAPERQARTAPRRRRAPSGMGVYPTVQVVPEAGRIPWPRIRYAVVLGEMNDRSRFRGAPLADTMRSEIHRALRVLRGVAVFPSQSAFDRDAERQTRRRRIPKLRIDGTLAEVRARRQRGELAVRCEVSLMLLDDGSIRGMMNGAATGSEPPRRDRREQTARLAQQALAAAVRSAMSEAPSALAQAARRGR